AHPHYAIVYEMMFDAAHIAALRADGKGRIGPGRVELRNCRPAAAVLRPIASTRVLRTFPTNNWPFTKIE
ncbi:MAG: hypothetical protein E6833_37525, partial [Bradyrhizobium sp.]|nr:hypothetical protein [Bradyrhizobium sp.]